MTPTLDQLHEYRTATDTPEKVRASAAVQEAYLGTTLEDH